MASSELLDQATVALRELIERELVEAAELGADTFDTATWIVDALQLHPEVVQAACPTPAAGEGS